MLSCSIDLCTESYCARGYCRNHYMQARRDGTLVGVRERKHILSNVDNVTMMADCANCGPVSVYRRPSNGRYECEIGKRYARAAYTKQAHGLSGIDARRYKKNKRCAICSSTRNLQVDHSHNLNLIRGVLCQSCNLILGLAKDNAEVLRAAADYLETTKYISADTLRSELSTGIA